MRFRVFAALALTGLAALAQEAVWRIRIPMQGSISQALSPDGKHLAVAPTFGPVLSFSLASGSLEEGWIRPVSRSYSLAWQAGGRGFFSGDPDGKDPEGVVAFGGSATGPIPGGTHQVLPSPNGHWLASVSYDALRVLDLRTKQLQTWMERPVQTWRLPVKEVCAILWEGPDRLLVVQGGYGGSVPFAVKRLDLAHRRALPEIPLPEGAVTTCASLSPEGRYLHLGTASGHLLSLDLQSGKLTHDRALGDAALEALALSSQGKVAGWMGDHLLFLEAADSDAPARSLPAWATGARGNGWRPLLHWIGGDLVLASGAADQLWRAERWSRAWETAAPQP